MAEQGISFEARLKELEETVALLERGELPLEESLAAFEKGTALVKTCKAELENLQLRVEKIVGVKDGLAEVEVMLASAEELN